jgi:hypothetical protein
MIAISAVIGVASCILGTYLALAWRANISGTIVVVLGACFGLTLVFAPNRGLLAGILRRRRQKWEFAGQLLVVHLLNHEAHPDEAVESELAALPENLRWERAFADRVVQVAERRGWIAVAGQQLKLTANGRAVAHQVMTR